MSLLSVDPGLSATGWALWHDGSLVCCGLVRAFGGTDAERSAVVGAGLILRTAALECGAARTLVELPQIYRAVKAKGDPNDVVRVAALVGWIEASFPRAVHERASPHDWKGTIPKARRLRDYVVHERNAKALGLCYLRWFETCPESLAHNVADAVGLGLWWLKRQQPRRLK